MINQKDNRKFNKGGKDRNRNQGGNNVGNGRNVQDLFLKYVAENHTPVTVFLICGVRLQGIVTHHDIYTLLLKREGHTQLVFKHSISTIMPTEPVQIMGEEQKEEETTDTAASDSETVSDSPASIDDDSKEECGFDEDDSSED